MLVANGSLVAHFEYWHPTPAAPGGSCLGTAPSHPPRGARGQTSAATQQCPLLHHADAQQSSRHCRAHAVRASRPHACA
eukprot:2830105-Prymnesium_polylepis.3